MATKSIFDGIKGKKKYQDDDDEEEEDSEDDQTFFQKITGCFKTKK